MSAHIYIPIGVMCDPSTYSPLGTGRDSLWPFGMVPWGKCIPHSCLCTFIFIWPTFDQLTFCSFREAEAKVTRLIILVLAAIHLGIAISFKVLFFSYYVVDKIGGDIDIPGVSIGGGGTTTPRWTWLYSPSLYLIRQETSAFPTCDVANIYALTRQLRYVLN